MCCCLTGLNNDKEREVRKATDAYTMTKVRKAEREIVNDYIMRDSVKDHRV